MKITTIASSSQDRNVLDVAFDVSKSRLECYARLHGDSGAAKQLEHRFANRPQQIQRELTKLHELARQAGYEGLRVVCEPTAGYENRLLHTARQAGHRTAYVSGEAVNKAQVIESNDTGKTDHKDPRTILMLARMGKTLTHRHLRGDWKLLRSLNVRYERLEAQMVELKNRIYPILDELFCELDFSKDWLFKSDAVPAAMKEFGLNPYRLLKEDETAVRKRLRAAGIKPRTIERLFAYARKSVLHEIDELHIEFLEEDLRMQYEDLRRCQERMQATRAEMIAALGRRQQSGEVRIEATTGLISPFMLARIIAETGPLSDFSNIRQLYRYAGLNLRQRQSGTWKGQTRLSKKGRALFRKVLSQAIIKRVVRGNLYAEYYHHKKSLGMIGPKAMTAVSRKFLKLLFGLQKSAEAYQPQRVFCCQSRYQGEEAA